MTGNDTAVLPLRFMNCVGTELLWVIFSLSLCLSFFQAMKAMAKNIS